MWQGQQRESDRRAKGALHDDPFGLIYHLHFMVYRRMTMHSAVVLRCYSAWECCHLRRSTCTAVHTGTEVDLCYALSTNRAELR
jgi:hypothetical protein